MAAVGAVGGTVGEADPVGDGGGAELHHHRKPPTHSASRKTSTVRGRGIRDLLLMSLPGEVDSQRWRVAPEAASKSSREWMQT